MYFGLSLQEIKRLAYEYGHKLDVNMPPRWTEMGMAGKYWLGYFLSRHPELTLRSPEATSLNRATSFNRHNVKCFFENLKCVLDRIGVNPEKIWNIDEIGCTTVQKPNKVIAAKGTKQVGTLVSAERGQLVTVCCAVNALGNSVPPMFIFPRVHFRDHFLKGAPIGSIGSAHPSGWMTTDNFQLFLHHFVKHTQATKHNPVVLLCDNHESHISVEGLDYASENGVVMLSFPPHCSHKLQPLDRTVYGPLNFFYNNSCESWMYNNPGKPMTIYEIPEMVGCAYPKSVTPANIQSGFRITGIHPFNENVFTDDEFLPSEITNRVQEPPSEMEVNDDEQPGTSGVPTSASGLPITPEHIRPFKKAPPRKRKINRRIGSTRILTDTPEKEKIRSAKRAKRLPSPEIQ